MRKHIVTMAALFMLAFLATGPAEMKTDNTAVAEEFFRGVYACDSSVVGRLASEDVVISYPVFETLFQKSGIQGREAVTAFATRFCSRWEDAEVTVHESVSEGSNVVLVWGFHARNSSSGEKREWGGISVFRFDASGKVVSEMGLESSPGPVERLAQVEASG